jgi:NAD(P)-dependent dehydrogenase (short-subunit alcohol dehydrogenase family)
MHSSQFAAQQRLTTESLSTSTGTMSFLDQIYSLRDKIALVTGAGRGIGKAIASGFLRAGATVVLFFGGSARHLATTQALRAEKLDAHSIPCDLSRPDHIESLADQLRGQFAKLDVLVNNAGITISHKLVDYPLEDWEKTIHVNLRGPFLLVQRLAGLMQERGGSVINITSLNAELGFPANPAYIAAKGGLKQLTKSMALDLGPSGIRVNNIGPGYFDTDINTLSRSDPIARAKRTERTILGRWGTPQDVVGLAVLLASDASSYITGQDIYVDGGWLAKGL